MFQIQRRADADILYGLLLNRQLNLTALGLGKELPLTEYAIDWRRRDLDTFGRWTFPRLGTLTNLELTLDCGWPGVENHAFYRSLIISSHSALRRLRILFLSNASMKRARTECSPRNILTGVKLPYLECHQIELQDSPSEIKRTKLPSKRQIRDRPARPSCQQFDIGTFLRRNLRPLKHIDFKNVIFVDEDPMRHIVPDNFSNTTSLVLQILSQESTDLEHFQ